MSLLRFRHERDGAAGLMLALSLLVLGIVLVSVQQRVNALRAQVYEVAEPTIDLIYEVQYLLARQTSALRGYLISRDTAYLDQYTSSYAVERDIYPRLARFAAELTPEISIEVAELMTLSERWHTRLAIEEIAAAGVAGAPPDAPVVLLEQELYRSTLELATHTAEDVRAFIRDRQAQIERIERGARLILAFLFLLAGVVAVAFSVLNTRIRLLAEEAERRRSETETALEHTARVVADREYLIRGFTHDVKNPLHVADGYADLLELGHKGQLDTAHREIVGRIRSSIHGAVAIIDELLEISRLESEGLQVKRQAVDLGDLTRQVVQEHAVMAARAELRLHFMEGSDPNAEIEALTDPTRVRQVLKNLVSNALKYTPSPGEVSVGIDTLSEDEAHRGSWARIVVTDTGPGIPFEEQERIFSEYHRAPGATGPGHGLGLAISRRVARICGGDVTVESVPGQGASFVLWLPLEVEEDQPRTLEVERVEDLDQRVAIE
jgi:signal transduction histidine kinase